MFDEDVEVNEYGTNTKIKAHILDDKTMKDCGFRRCTDNFKNVSYWFYTHDIMDDISFNVSIYNDLTVRIDVIDENFGQPYDYQHILRTSISKFATDVWKKVETEMNRLIEARILSGHEEGEYI